MTRGLIRLLLVVLLAPVLIGAAPAARDWTRTVTRTADGAYIVGNPAAKVRLVEYLSYTCPHCAHYAEQSAPTLKGQFVRSGSTRVELRHATRDKIDLAATVIARCGGPGRFVAMSDRLFATQADWYIRGLNFQQANGARIELYPENAKLRAIADGSGLSDLARANGLSEVQLTACFDDMPALLQLAVMSDRSWQAIAAAAAPQPGGTPTFAVNNRAYANLDWAGLEKVLRAAGAR